MTRRISHNNSYTTGVVSSGVYRAIVTAVTGSTVSVKVPKLSTAAVYTDVPYSGFTPAVGDDVWVLFIEGRSNRLMVIAGASEVDPAIFNSDVIINGTLDVSGLSTLDDINSTGNVDVTGTLDVTGVTTVTSLDASSNVDITGTLDVTGATTVTSLNASGNVDITGTLDVTGAVDFSSTLHTVGDATFDANLSAAHVTAEFDGPLLIACKNTSGVTINKGDPVYVTGSVGASGVVTISKSQGSLSATVPCIGLAYTTLANNGQGHIITSGVFRNINTSSYALNDVLYVGDSGGLSKTPSAYFPQHVAKVIRQHATTGEIVVSIVDGSTTTIQMVDFVVDDGVTDNVTVVNATIAASPKGSVIDFRGLRYPLRVGSTIDLLEQRTYIFANNAGMWPYRQVNQENSGVSLFQGSIKAMQSFTPSDSSNPSVVRIVGQLNNPTNDTDNNANQTDTITVHGMVVDASAVDTATVPKIDCVRIEGLVRDTKFYDCVAYRPKGTGVGSGAGFKFTSRSGGTAVPRGVRMERCVVQSSDDHGFRFDSTTDFSFYDLLAASCGGRGFYHTSAGAGVYVNCASGFNSQNGFYLDGTPTVGQVSFVGCVTDRNAQDGFRVDQKGSQPVLFVGCQSRRDGKLRTSNRSSGFLINGTASGANLAAPVDIIGCQVTTGVGDNIVTDPNNSPLYGVYANYASRVTVHGGDYWGETAGYGQTAGTNSIIDWTPQTRWWSGVSTRAAQTPTKTSGAVLAVVDGGTGLTAAGANDTILTADSVATAGVSWKTQQVAFFIEVVPENNLVTTGASKVTFRMPYGMIVSSIRGSLKTASTSTPVDIDVKRNGFTIYSTQLRIDAGSETSVGSGTTPVFVDGSTTTFADDAKVTVDITGTSSTTAAGLKLTFIGRRS